MKGLIAALMLLIAVPAFAAGPVLSLAAGTNAISFDGVADLPSDFELGGNAAVSLSPHISGVGSAYFGLGQSYLRGTVGVRVTATDVQNQAFSAGFGASYVASDKPSLRPSEWNGEAAVGIVPWPEMFPRITLVALGGYGLTSNQASILFGARYSFPIQ